MESLYPVQFSYGTLNSLRKDQFTSQWHDTTRLVANLLTS